MYEQLAITIMFSGASLATLENAGLTLRKGKTFDDLRAAVQRGVKAGKGKLEHELSMIEVQLRGVLKPLKVASA